MHVNRATIMKLVHEVEDLFGLRRRDHNFGLSHEVRQGVLATYDSQKRRFLSPSINTEVVMFHESVHYLMEQRGIVFRTTDKSIYGGLLDEMIAFIAPMEVYDYDHSFKLESYTDEDARKDHLGDPYVEVILTGLSLAKRHREIEMKLPPGSPEEVDDANYVIRNIGDDLIDFKNHASKIPLESRIEAGELLAVDVASRLLRMGLDSRGLYDLLDHAIQDRTQPYKLYFGLIGTAKVEDPDFLLH